MKAHCLVLKPRLPSDLPTTDPMWPRGCHPFLWKSRFYEFLLTSVFFDSWLEPLNKLLDSLKMKLLKWPDISFSPFRISFSPDTERRKKERKKERVPYLIWTSRTKKVTDFLIRYFILVWKTVSLVLPLCTRGNASDQVGSASLRDAYLE